MTHHQRYLALIELNESVIYVLPESIIAIVAKRSDKGEYSTVFLSSGATFDVQEAAYVMSQRAGHRS